MEEKQKGVNIAMFTPFDVVAVGQQPLEVIATTGKALATASL
jgi:hypothetical protein